MKSLTQTVLKVTEFLILTPTNEAKKLLLVNLVLRWDGPETFQVLLYSAQIKQLKTYRALVWKKPDYSIECYIVFQKCPSIHWITIVLVMGIPYTFQINNIYKGVMKNIGVLSVEVAKSDKPYLPLAKLQVVFRSHRQELKILDG